MFTKFNLGTHKECMAIQCLCLFFVRKLNALPRLRMISTAALLLLYDFMALTFSIPDHYMWDLW